MREENLAQQVKEAILKASLDDGLFSQMMDQLNHDKTLFEAEKVHNRISAETQALEIDEQLKRLLDLSVSGVISDEEYKEKKARLVNKKFELQAKGSRDGEWLERYKNLITLAHQASYIAAEANFEAQRDFLKRLGSNFRLYNSTLLVSYTSVFKIFSEKQKYNLGSMYSKGRIIVEK